MNDRSADCVAGLVADQVAARNADREGGDGVDEEASVAVEEVAREGVGAVEPENLAANVIGSLLARDIDQTSEEPPVFRAEPVGDDVYLTRPDEREALSERRPVIDDVLAAVQVHVVGGRSLAVYGEILKGLGVGKQVDAAGGNATHQVDRRDVARKCDERIRITGE